jgi:hypothetical protein
MTDGEVGGTAPNTTAPVPRNEQLPFSCPHNLYCWPATVIVLVCAWTFSAPIDANTVADATPSNLKYLIVIRMYCKEQVFPENSARSTKVVPLWCYWVQREVNLKTRWLRLLLMKLKLDAQTAVIHCQLTVHIELTHSIDLHALYYGLLTDKMNPFDGSSRARWTTDSSWEAEHRTHTASVCDGKFKGTTRRPNPSFHLQRPMWQVLQQAPAKWGK